MRHVSESDAEIVRYLLGELQDSERDELEDRFFADDALHDLLLSIEDELIDSYVRGELPAQQEKRFEDWFLRSVERREKVKFARDLLAYNQAHLGADSLAVTSSSVDPTLTKNPSSDAVLNDASDRPKGIARFFSGFWHGWKLSPQLAFASAALIVSVIAVTILHRSVPPEPTVRNKVIQQQVAQTEKKLVRPSTPAAAPKSKGAESRVNANPPMILAFALSPAQRGAAEGNTLKIPSSLPAIRLDLSLPPGDYQEYAASVENLRTGKTIVRRGLPETTGGVFRVKLLFSSTELPPGEYVVRLMGGANGAVTDTVAGYSFRTDPGAGRQGSFFSDSPMLAAVIPANNVSDLMGGKNGALKQFCSEMSPILRKYPFNSLSQSDNDATLVDIARGFAPTEGLVWKYVQKSASELVVRSGQEWQPNPAAEAQGIKVTPELVAFLNRAQSLTSVMFSENGMMQPRLRYVLRPSPGQSVTIRLLLDGEQFTSANPLQKTFFWPAPVGARAGAEGTIEAGAFSSGFGTFDGIWGVFRLFQSADERPYGTRFVQWSEIRGRGGAVAQRLNPPVKVELVEFPGGVDLLNPKFFEPLRCPDRALAAN